MYTRSKLLLNICVTSLVASISVVNAVAPSYSSTESSQSKIEIAQANKNPCAGKNPCASKNNPCAGKLGSVGGALSPQLQGKPVVVDIYASWCPACKNIAPTLSQLKQQYGNQVHFVVFDVSNKNSAKQSEEKAKQLGLSQYFSANKSKTGTVTIIDPKTGNILAQEVNNANKSDYTKVLDTQLSKK